MENKPEIRFKGFTDDWEQCELGEFGKATGGTSIESEFDKNGKYKVISIGSYSETNKYKDQGIRTKKTKKTEKRILNKNDLTMILNDKTTSGNIIGRVLLIDADNSYVYNQRTERIEVNENDFDSKFLYQFLNSDKMRSKIIYAAQGNTQIYVNWNDISVLGYKLPILKEEQKKIGDFFNEVDQLITLHQRKVSNLKKVKSTMLEKMFPKDGEKVPEIRFKGFTDDWEQCKIYEMADRYDNLRVPIAANLRVPGDTPYYGANGIQDYVEGYTHNGEFVLVAEDGANDLKNYPVKYVKGHIWVNNHAHVLQGKTGFADNKFLAYSINRADIEDLLVGGGRAKLNAETLMNIELILPRLNEQRAIGRLLNNLDTLINFHQREIENLQRIKQTLLDKMFV